MTDRKTRRRIPEFKSIEEEAEFWDTHSLADYTDELKPARVRFAKNLSEPVSFRLDTATLERVRSIAHGMGIGPTTLIRMWVLECLKTFEQHSTPAKH